MDIQPYAGTFGGPGGGVQGAEGGPVGGAKIALMQCNDNFEGCMSGKLFLKKKIALPGGGGAGVALQIAKQPKWVGVG